MDKSFAEKLVDDLIDKVEEYGMSSAKPIGPRHAAMVEAREAVIQALTVPARTEEDDFLSVWDTFAAAALDGLCNTGMGDEHLARSRAQNAAWHADAMMAERAKRMAPDADKRGNPQ